MPLVKQAAVLCHGCSLKLYVLTVSQCGVETSGFAMQQGEIVCCSADCMAP